MKTTPYQPATNAILDELGQEIYEVGVLLEKKLALVDRSNDLLSKELGFIVNHLEMVFAAELGDESYPEEVALSTKALVEFVKEWRK